MELDMVELVVLCTTAAIQGVRYWISGQAAGRA